MAKLIEGLDDLRGITASEIGKMKLDELKRAMRLSLPLLSGQEQLTADFGEFKRHITEEITVGKSERGALQQSVKRLENENNYLRNAMGQHQ